MGLLFTDLELQPPVIEGDGAEVQVAELFGESICPTDGFIEQLRAKQLLEFVLEECAEGNA